MTWGDHARREHRALNRGRRRGVILQSERRHRQWQLEQINRVQDPQFRAWARNRIR